MREKFSIPGFKLDLTPPQQIFTKALKENGFKFDMLRGSAATVKLVKERKYGYINNDVTRHGGVVGFTFPPQHIDASPFSTEEKTIEWFVSKYPASKEKVKTYRISKGIYLFILDVDLALKVCGVISKTATIISGEKLKGGNYKQVQTECVKCFQKMGGAAEFTKDGNIIRCMKDLATPGWPNDWIEWVKQNAGQIIKGVEIDK
jgi:hypothetical protein